MRIEDSLSRQVGTAGSFNIPARRRTIQARVGRGVGRERLAATARGGRDPVVIPMSSILSVEIAPAPPSKLPATAIKLPATAIKGVRRIS